MAAKMATTMAATTGTTMATTVEPMPDIEAKRDAEVIVHASVATPFGTVLVARSGRGICSVELGDDVLELERALSADFPDAVLRRDEAAMGPIVAAVAGLVASPERVGAVPLEEALPVALDERGTDFQRTVWRALRRIAPGTTTTYGELARSIGRPTAARAVARACATNRIAVLTPCHRVVGKDGALTGYRWGITRKRALLTYEAG
jgi:AraC family transcriptional regulator, regulatory protein of adaptative response / methylated-DNA-[protein]-cysteine methyltransferase